MKVSGKTSSDFKFEIETDMLDDMRLIDAMAEVEEDFLKVSKVVLMVLGKEQRDRLYKHLETEKGTVPTQAVYDALMEIMTYSPETKNL